MCEVVIAEGKTQGRQPHGNKEMLSRSAPKNCEIIQNTSLLAIWNSLSEKARKADIILQKEQRSHVKGATAVVSVVNNLITAPGMPSKTKF